MGFFTRTKTANPPQQQPPQETGKKINLNFGGLGSKAVLEMAATTLEAGGFDVKAANKPKPVEIGDEMPDGTKYAGISPDTGEPMYATPADAPLTMKWKEAMDYAGELGMRLPTKGELNVLFNNSAAIGGFNITGSDPEGWYWSASEYGKWDAWCQRFSDGYQTYVTKDCRSSVRCVR